MNQFFPVQVTINLVLMSGDGVSVSGHSNVLLEGNTIQRCRVGVSVGKDCTGAIRSAHSHIPV
jgi:hypothetical protein